MIALVGCGFLGSILVEELGKRWFAFQENEPIKLIDFDTFEERNSANQNITRKRAETGVYKSMASAVLLREYGVSAHPLIIKLDKFNVGDTLRGDSGEEPSLIISAVDNLPTRDLLWYYAKQHKIPLLSLGISQQGTGTVEWTVSAHDSYSLSPLATLGQARKLAHASNIPKELKPCELIAFRGLGLNMAVAAAKAVGIYKGFDPEKVLSQEPLPRTVLTVWDATNTGHTLRDIVEVDDGEG